MFDERRSCCKLAPLLTSLLRMFILQSRVESNNSSSQRAWCSPHATYGRRFHRLHLNAQGHYHCYCVPWLANSWKTRTIGHNFTNERVDPMSALRTSSTPRTSFASVRETTVQELNRRIHEAVDSTTVGINSNNDAYSHCFLPKMDLADVLNRGSLQRLFRELLTDNTDISPTTAQENSRDGTPTENCNHTAKLDSVIESYVNRTLGDPPRIALLALFLYEDLHAVLLVLFMEWLMFSRAGFPSDDDMPFSKDLVDDQIPLECRRSILRDQNIFKPIMIKKDKHQEFRDRDRLPYIGKPALIENGSSGTVFSTTIARGHWEIKSHGCYVTGNPEEPMVVAVKSFRQASDVVNRQEATDEFEDECKILEAIRSSKIKHEMIMLDWGSITIRNEAGTPISRSLIFELATFSLKDFLKDERRARTYTKNGLFARLVDIVEALACLHDSLKILHLDIKPDNILVFERGLSQRNNNNEDERELVWKLSDFGLARKKNAKSRTGLSGRGRSYHTFESSALPAPRCAGVYQAPEIQMKDFSRAGRRSDVWSMGCVTLMVLAFVTDGISEVSTLESNLIVNFKQQSGKERLFYIRSDSYPWDRKSVYHYTYMDHFDPVVGKIPGTDHPLEAAIHPLVIEWSNVLHDSYKCPVEQAIVREVLEVIFCHVLLIDRDQRIKAAEFGQRLANVQERWKLYEDNLENSTRLEKPSSFEEANKPILTKEDLSMRKIASKPPEPAVLKEKKIPAPSVVKEPLPEQDERLQNGQRSLNQVYNHSALCSAIKDDNSHVVRSELARDVGQLKRPCAQCDVYPIHKALRNKAYEAFRELLKESDLSVAEIRCPESGGQTAVELASNGSGDSKALEYFLERRDKFHATEELYRDRKGLLSSESKTSLKKLCKSSELQSGRLGFFGRRRN